MSGFDIDALEDIVQVAAIRDALDEEERALLARVLGSADPAAARAAYVDWLDERGETLSIREMVTECDDHFVQKAPFPSLSGVLGGVGGIVGVLVGVGPGMYGWHIRRYQTVSVTKQYDHAHNDYLEVAVEGGLIAAALLLWLMAVFTASVALFMVFARMRYPLVPLLLPFAGLARAGRTPDETRRVGSVRRRLGPCAALRCRHGCRADSPRRSHRTLPGRAKE